MGFISILSCAQQWVSQRIHLGDVAIDATVGTGVDTLFLARAVGIQGLVIGLDVQQKALCLTECRLEKHRAEQPISPVSLHLENHANITTVVPTHLHGKIGAVMFNLGYLPTDTADKTIVTQAPTTLKALQRSFDLLRPKGIITVVLYPGHPTGKQECTLIYQWVSSLPTYRAQAILYKQVQRPNTPYIIGIEKKGGYNDD